MEEETYTFPSTLRYQVPRSKSYVLCSFLIFITVQTLRKKKVVRERKRGNWMGERGERLKRSAKEMELGVKIFNVIHDYLGDKK